MALNDAMLPEFDNEMANTRKVLERVPDDKLTWKPHPKSGTLGWLATHVAQLPGWAVVGIGQDSLDIAPGGVPPKPQAPAGSRQELLEIFDKNVKDGRAAIAGADDAHLMKPWSLLWGGNPIFTMPRAAMLRSSVMNHLIHHRGQLQVYLRLNDVAVPGLYGPSADEPGM